MFGCIRIFWLSCDASTHDLTTHPCDSTKGCRVKRGAACVGSWLTFHMTGCIQSSLFGRQHAPFVWTILISLYRGDYFYYQSKKKNPCKNKINPILQILLLTIQSQLTPQQDNKDHKLKYFENKSDDVKFISNRE